MRKKICELEKEVIDCLKAEKLSPEMKKHISICPFCKDVVYVYRWIKQFKSRSWDAGIMEQALPDSETIWNRAYEKRRRDKRLEKKVLRPLIYPRVFSYGVLIIGIIFLFLSNMRGIGNIINSSSGVGIVLDTLLKIIDHIFPYFFIPMIIVFISLIFCVFVTAFENRKKTV